MVSLSMSSLVYWREVSGEGERMFVGSVRGCHQPSPVTDFSLRKHDIDSRQTDTAFGGRKTRDETVCVFGFIAWESFVCLPSVVRSRQTPANGRPGQKIRN